MIEREEKLDTDEGTMGVFIVRPDGDGPFPAVIQIMDALGMREELREHARRVASRGYYVLSPDLFYRFGLEAPLSTDEKGMKTIMGAVKALTDERAVSDVKAVLESAQRDNVHRSKRSAFTATAWAAGSHSYSPRPLVRTLPLALPFTPDGSRISPNRTSLSIMCRPSFTSALRTTIRWPHEKIWRHSSEGWMRATSDINSSGIPERFTDS
jgi:Dienelactone hydrolase family